MADFKPAFKGNQGGFGGEGVIPACFTRGIGVTLCDGQRGMKIYSHLNLRKEENESRPGSGFSPKKPPFTNEPATHSDLLLSFVARAIGPLPTSEITKA